MLGCRKAGIGSHVHPRGCSGKWKTTGLLTAGERETFDLEKSGRIQGLRMGYLMAGLGSSSEDEGDSPSESGEDETPKLPHKRPQAKAKTQAAGPSSPKRPPTPKETKAPSPGPQDNSDTEGEQSEGQDNGAEDSGDTEDELRRVAKQREQKPPAPGENGEDPYAGSTDENTDTEADLPIPELPVAPSSPAAADSFLLSPV
ncbi:DNA repair protein XRCC1 [Microtus ochrogaster]|uniref:DNA repair protein XRCC1 n=1 Tax=Microtus ochrogaster TaxID=79684 RepID=A0A8J6KRQ9_MICOH|nr:DNA repair protein XRCC1 [Microtus ochrogaster]